MNMATPKAQSGTESILAYAMKWAQETPHATAFTFLAEEHQTTISYSKLWSHVQARASYLQQGHDKNTPVILCFAPGLGFVENFLACLLVGIPAIPLYPPKANQKKSRIDGVIKNSGAQAVLCDQASALLVERGLKSFIDDGVIRVDIAPADMDCNAIPPADFPALYAPCSPPDIAFIQYTSGSTGTPKGVVISHENIIANLQLLVDSTQANQADVFVNWLPLFHDLGLINTLLLPLYLGAHSVLMAPAQFLQRPLSWLQAISDYQGSICGGPNFAYDHCIQKVDSADLANLNLSSWRIAFNAAEPIHAQTLLKFSRLCEPAGFKSGAFFPSYGMAEATVFICGGHFDASAIKHFCSQSIREGRASLVQHKQDSIPLVACGFVGRHHALSIVNPDTGALCTDGIIGEIWCSGPSIARGYWQDAHTSKNTFENTIDSNPEYYLRTGDLGFILDGELFISGRQKDVLILNGQNIFPQDIEWLVIECDPIIDRMSVAAFMYQQQGANKIAVAIEVTRMGLRQLKSQALVDKIAQTIRSKIALELELAVEVILFLPPGQLPKTSSGKVQRALTKTLYTDQLLKYAGKSELSARTELTIETSPQDGPENKIAKIWGRILGRDLSAKHLAGSSFFAEGGDSIQLTLLAVELSREFNCSISLQELLPHLAFADQVTWLQKKPQDFEPVQLPKITKTDLTQYPMSEAQQRLWFLQQIIPDHSMLNISVELVLRGPLNISLFEHAWQQTIIGHPILLAGLVPVGDAVYVKRAAYCVAPPRFCDLSQIANRQQDLEQIRQLHNEYQFELLSEKNHFAHLVQWDLDTFHLLFTVHHIAADANAFDIFLRDLTRAYQTIEQPSNTQSDKAGIDYLDYAQWLSSQTVEEGALDFWKTKLAGIPRAISLPYDFRKPAQKSYAGAVLRKDFSQIDPAVKAAAANYALTPFSIYMAAYSLMLSYITGQKDLVIGTDVANRELAQVQQVFGFFVNQLAIKSTIDKNYSGLEWLRCCQAEVVSALGNQSVPFERIVDALGLQGQLDISPIFQSKLLLNQSPLKNFTLPNIAIQRLDVPVRHAQYDLTFAIDIEADERVSFACHYDTTRFLPESISAFMDIFSYLLEQLLEQPEIKISQLDYLTAPQHTWLADCGQGVAVDKIEKLHWGLEAQAQNSPQRIACIEGQNNYTYAEINQRVNQLAHLLLTIGAQDAVIGIAVPAGGELLCSLLAALKIGATFVPLDVQYPEERLRYMLEDSEVSVLIGMPDTLSIYADIFVGVSICLETSGSIVDAQPRHNPDCAINRSNLAYILYTSGSTGRPKGVKVSYRALENLCAWYKDFCAMDEHDVMLQLIPFGFDASIKNYIVPMMVGASLVIPDMKVFDAQAIVKQIQQHRVSITNCIPSVLNAILTIARPTNYSALPSLKFVALGGEHLHLSNLKHWISNPTFESTIANIYGPTECTDISVAHKLSATQLRELVSDNKIDNFEFPIGSPIYNAQVKVLSAEDEHHLPMLQGCIGELFISGDGLAEGYINAEQTKSSFIKFQNTEGTYYQTGDLVKWNAEGQLIYIGRADEQIKINGIRIELAEIERCLLETGFFNIAVVLKRENHLIAYLQAKDYTAPSSQQLKTLLKNKVSSAAVPQAFIYLSEFKKLPNGKFDRAHLLSLPAPKAETPSLVFLPKTDKEETLSAAVKALLKIDSISMRDNFFELGGDSILSVQLVSLLSSKGFDLAVLDIFETGNFEELAQRLISSTAVTEADIDTFDFISAEDLLLLNE
jgi:amino acid adenylation domain-containing protein